MEPRMTGAEHTPKSQRAARRSLQTAERLRRSGPGVSGCEGDWHLEHKIRRRNAGERSYHLSGEVERNLIPREPTLRGVGQRHGRVEVSSRDRSEGKDEGHERCTGGDGVGEE